MVPNYKTSLGGVVGDATNSMVSTLKLVARLNSEYGFDSVCFAHVLQKVITKAFSNVPEVKPRSNSIWRYSLGQYIDYV
jgi:hypothetical protein